MKSSPNDHRVRITKKLIRHALTDLMRNKPIQNISVKELCEKAGINRGTFYAHYEDIYDLMNQIEQELLDDFVQVLAPIYLDADKGHFLRNVCKGIFRLLQENSDICTVLLGEHSDKSFMDTLLRYGRDSYLAAYPQYFEKATPLQLEYFYAFISNGCIGMVRYWLAEGMRVSSDEVAHMAEEFMLKGVEIFLQA